MDVQKDLFGEIVIDNRKKITTTEKKLANSDRESLSDRINRAEDIDKIWEANHSRIVNHDLSYIIEEIRECYISGYYFAAIFLINSFFDKTFFNFFANKGLTQIAKYGFDNMISYSREYELLPYDVLTQINKLRSIIHKLVRTNSDEISDEVKDKERKIETYNYLQKETMDAVKILWYVIDSDSVVGK